MKPLGNSHTTSPELIQDYEAQSLQESATVLETLRNNLKPEPNKRLRNPRQDANADDTSTTETYTSHYRKRGRGSM